MKVKMFSGILMVIFIVSIAIIVTADPTGPTITEGAPERRTDGLDGSTGTTIAAQAGNVTQLTINSTSLTTRWQGYFGNVTGAITLDDASNNTLYDWELASPQGEIYASNESAVTWGNIDCINFTANKSVEKYNLTDLENMFGMGSSDNDGVDETFNETYAGSFNVGGTTINSASNCPMTYLYVSDNYQTTDFQEVLLTDNSSIIFTSLLEQDTTGYDSSTWDFQMIVGEDGDTAGATNYYFFVELT